jgi:phosphatidate cytidylyltransferase
LLRTRILTAVVLAVIVAFSVFGLETTYAALVFGLFWLIGSDEWAKLSGFSGVARRLYAAVFAAFVIVVLVAGLPPAVTTGLLSIAAVAWIGNFYVVLKFPQPMPRGAIAIVGWIVLAAAWFSFYRIHQVPAIGPALIVTGLAIVWSADIGAYFTGRSLGRTPLAPRVSPKKTWEGVVGGVVLATMTGCLAALILDQPLLLFGPIAAAMALISVVGDLSVSLLKRYSGFKDSGVLLPGHGGILDRFDGVTAALPFFVLGLQFAHVLD